MDKSTAELLCDASCIQGNGTFTLKSGATSPIYINCRALLAHPAARDLVVARAASLIRHDVDLVCGVPEGATALAALIAAHRSLPLTVLRKVKKAGYGIPGSVFGAMPMNDSGGANGVLLVEDVVTSGGSTIEAARTLTRLGYRCIGVVCLVDRRGTNVPLKHDGEYPVFLPVHALCSMYDCLHVLRSTMSVTDLIPVLPTRLRDEGASPTSIIARLCSVIRTKQTALCFSADVLTWSRLHTLVTLLAPYLCMVKVHPRIVDGFDAEAFRSICEAANIMILLDDKVADIGSVTARQLDASVRTLRPQLITAHALPGPTVLRAVAHTGAAPVVVTSMSSAGTLATGEYHDAAVSMAAAAGAPAIVSQRPCRLPGMLVLTPGVRGLETDTSSVVSDGAGQRWNTVESKYLAGTDVVIVGRGIYNADNPMLTAAAYAKRSWECFTAGDMQAGDGVTSHVLVEEEDKEYKEYKVSKSDNVSMCSDEGNGDTTVVECKGEADESKGNDGASDPSYSDKSTCTSTDETGTRTSSSGYTAVKHTPVQLHPSCVLSTPVYGASCIKGGTERQWLRRLLWASREGAVLTKTISYRPILDAPAPVVHDGSDYMINAVRMANIGSDRVTSFLVREHGRRLKLGDKMTAESRWKRPFIVSIHVEPSQVSQWFDVLTSWVATKCCAGIEWNLACPNIESSSKRPNWTRISRTIRALKHAAGPMAFGLKLPSMANVSPLINILSSAPVKPDFIVCANAIGGCSVFDSKTHSVLGSATGSISGTVVNRGRAHAMLRGLQPLALTHGIPMIACGGATCAKHVREFLDIEGVVAVQVGAAFVRRDLHVFDAMVMPSRL